MYRRAYMKNEIVFDSSVVSKWYTEVGRMRNGQNKNIFEKSERERESELMY